MRKIYVGAERAKDYKIYNTLKEARARAKELGGYVSRLHDVYNRTKFYGYVVSYC
jgi:hypothetical protein